MEEYFSEEIPHTSPKPKYGILKEIAIMLVFFICYSTCYVWIAARKHAYTSISADSTEFITSSSDNSIVDVNDPSAVNNYLFSKKFRNDNMSIRFEPGGYYELKKDSDVVLTGTWRTGERKYDSSIMLYLSSQSGNLTFMLSSDGKIIDKSSLRIFK